MKDLSIADSLSILIPARNEQFLSRTIEDILKNKRGKTEIIVGLDGEWSDPPISDHHDVTILYYPESIGQRAMVNRLCKLSKGKYVMKADAHCAFGEGFDIKMMEAMRGHDDWTMVPIMKNLHAFDWVCKKCGTRRYQGPSGPCKKCGGETEKDILWRAKPSPNSTSYCFNPEPKFKYFREYAKRPEYRKDLEETGLTETMSLQGSCFMMTRDKYWELNVCDEEFGSWGSQGIEISCKVWLSGGRVVCNHNTFYAHLFRTQGSDFGFPYPLSGNQVERAKKKTKDMFFNNNWSGQKYPLSWLVKKFWPIHCWEQKDLDELITQETKQEWHDKTIEKTPSKCIIFYTDNKLPIKLAKRVQKNLKKISQEKGIPIVCCSLKKMNFGDKNVHFPSLKRGYVSMFKQILAGLEASTADIIFFAEHDILYSSTHFDFIPPKKDVYYYNLNVWKIRIEDGHALKVDDCKQVSGLCAYRELLLEHYRKRVETVESKLKEYGEDTKGFNKFIHNMGFEAGTQTRKERVDDFKAEGWESACPNLDIRHKNNLTSNRWTKDKFRNQKYTAGWTEADEILGWGKTSDLIKGLN